MTSLLPKMPYTPCMMQLACAVICPLVDDVASVARVHSRAPKCFEVVQEKDYILHPKPNGYRSYHMILARTNDSELDPDATRRAATKAAIEAQEISLSQLIDQLNTSGTFDTVESKGAEAQTGDNRFEFGRRMCVEVQLRTIAMDSWASIEHDLKYKKDVPNQEFLQAELKRCADEMAATDLSLQTIADLINVK